MEAGNHSLQEAISCGGMVSRKIQQLFRERHMRRPLPDLEKTLARQLRHRRGAVGLPIRVFTMVARKQPRKEVKNPECIRIRDFWWRWGELNQGPKTLYPLKFLYHRR